MNMYIRTDQNKFIPTLLLSIILICVGYFLICVHDKSLGKNWLDVV